MTTAPACCCVQQQLSDLRRLNRCLEHEVRPAGVRGEINFWGTGMLSRQDWVEVRGALRGWGSGGPPPEIFEKLIAGNAFSKHFRRSRGLLLRQNRLSFPTRADLPDNGRQDDTRPLSPHFRKLAGKWLFSHFPAIFIFFVFSLKKFFFGGGHVPPLAPRS